MAGKAEANAWKVLGLAAAVGAGIVARKLTTATWEKTTGAPPPTNPADPEVSWPEALAWAVTTGAVVGVARMLAGRRLAGYWKKSFGHLPPGVQEVS